MSIKIRLTRVGRRNSPSYRVVVADSRERRDGRFIDIIGYYQPLRGEAKVKVDEEKVILWLSRGATPTDTMRSILRKLGILKRFHDEKKSVTAVGKES